MPVTANARAPAREILRANIIIKRAQKRFSQTDLAERAGVSRPTISRIERAVSDIGIDVVERIAKALDLTIAQLFAPLHTGRVDDEELARRAATPDDEFVDAEDLIRALDEAAGRPIERYSRAGRPRVAR
jgi:transcriptional regulator with XRE-family HTH domain